MNSTEKRLFWTLVALSLILGSRVAVADYGPYKADFVRAYDADSFTLRLHIFPGQYWEGNTRMEGLDTPERSWRAGCKSEREAAELAKSYVIGLLENTKDLKVSVSGNDKYGRPLVTVTADGADLKELIISAGYARAYGGGKRGGWC